MKMKKNMLIWIFISMLMDRKKELGSYKMEILIGKVGDNYFKS
jgi:hypothetical protein